MAAPAQIASATADRLAEAAQLLLDAARAAHKENPDYVAGTEYVSEPLALAVQALFMADIWDQAPHGQAVRLDRDRTVKRVRGLGTGVGICLAILPPVAQVPCTLVLQHGLNEGLRMGRDFKSATR